MRVINKQATPTRMAVLLKSRFDQLGLAGHPVRLFLPPPPLNIPPSLPPKR